MRIQSKGKAEMSTNRVSQFEGLRRGNGRLLERALAVVRCVEWPALVVAGRADVKQPALVVVGRVNLEQSGLVERVGPAADGLGSHLRRTAPVGQKVCLQAQNGYAPPRGWLGEEMPERAACRIEIKGNGRGLTRWRGVSPFVTVRAEGCVDG